MSTKIKTLRTPQGNLESFDPGRYLGSLEFYESAETVTEADRDVLAQFVHLLAFAALRGGSIYWEASTVDVQTSAFSALQSHYGHLSGWMEIVEEEGIAYRSLASFLLVHYPPHKPGKG